MVYVCTSVRTSTVPWFVTLNHLGYAILPSVRTSTVPWFVTLNYCNLKTKTVRKDIHGAVVCDGWIVSMWCV